MGENWRPSVAALKHYRCQACISKNRRDYYKENQPRIRELVQLRRYENVENAILIRAKSRAKKCNLEFNLDITDIQIPELCPVLKIKLVFGSRTGNTPSIDRIDSTKGYVKGNVQIISHLANTMKNNATPEQLLQFSLWVQETYGKSNV